MSQPKPHQFPTKEQAEVRKKVAAFPAQPEAPQQETKPAPQLKPIPRELAASGWLHSKITRPPKILYGMIRTGRNYIGLRLELQADGSVQILELPENIRQIIADRLIDLMLQETI